MQAASSSKRTIEDVEGAEEVRQPVNKKPAWDFLDDFGDLNEPQLGQPADDPPNSSSILPPPSDTVIQLRFQLCRFNGVYRVARIPLTFTFAHLYRFILLIFGWSGHHLHQAEVLTHVELYKAVARRGEVKKHRNYRIPQAPKRGDSSEYWQEWLMQYGFHCRGDEPAMRVTPGGPRQRRVPLDMNDPWDARYAELEVPVKKDSEVTMGDIWARKQRKNLTKGVCTNEEIAIHLEYDLGSSWDVHVTVDTEENGEYMWRDKTSPRNYPVITAAKGGAPVEDAHSDVGEIDAKKKKVPPILFLPDTFEKFLQGKIRSRARKTELEVYDVEEENARRQAMAAEKEQRRLEKQQAGQDEVPDDEDEEEYYTEDED